MEESASAALVPPQSVIWHDEVPARSYLQIAEMQETLSLNPGGSSHRFEFVASPCEGARYAATTVFSAIPSLGSHQPDGSPKTCGRPADTHSALAVKSISRALGSASTSEPMCVAGEGRPTSATTAPLKRLFSATLAAVHK